MPKKASVASGWRYLSRVTFAGVRVDAATAVASVGFAGAAGAGAVAGAGGEISGAEAAGAEGAVCVAPAAVSGRTRAASRAKRRIPFSQRCGEWNGTAVAAVQAVRGRLP